MNAVLNELRFNIIIWVLITAYWTNGIWNLISYTPGQRKSDDEIFHLNKCNYTFRLISSLIFFFLWISQFQYPILVYLTVIEIVIVIVVYLKLMICKHREIKEHNHKAWMMRKSRIEEIKKR